ncbi:hypothetical protein D3C71_1177770 [compost metagenome]
MKNGAIHLPWNPSLSAVFSAAARLAFDPNRVTTSAFALAIRRTWGVKSVLRTSKGIDSAACFLLAAMSISKPRLAERPSSSFSHSRATRLAFRPLKA